MSLAFSAFKLLASPWLLNQHRRFALMLNEPDAVQAKTLSRILKLTGQERLPDEPQEFSSIRNLDRLTSEPVRFYETTSGSGGVKKQIPYNKSLLRAYEDLFVLWISDLLYFSKIPFSSGKFFMSISPKISSDFIQDDSRHVSWGLQKLLRLFLVSPPESHQAETTEEFFNSISHDLLKARDLEALSLWSPSYFQSIMNHIEKLRAPEEGSVNWEKIWPNLKLISCWADGPSQPMARKLEKLFPNVHIQGKGLLATEGPFTLPWTAAQGSVPLLNHVFFEFLDHAGRIRQLSEVKEGESYELLPSTPGGLLRYRIKDRVEVTQFHGKTPCLAFRGRANFVSDLVGEKISEDLLLDVFGEASLSLLFMPGRSPEPHHYECWTEGPEWNPDEIEGRLCRIHHYNLARKLRQLGPVQVNVVPRLKQNLLDFYSLNGQRLGDIKEKLLIPSAGEAERFRAFLRTRSPPSPQP